MTYDEACATLARRLLEDVAAATDRDIALLAEALQAACEDACERIEEREKANDCGGTMQRGMRGFTGGAR